MALTSGIMWASGFTRSWDRFDHAMLALFVVIALPAIFTTVGVIPYAEGVGKFLIPSLA